MADVDLALCQQVLDISQQEREADIHHNYQPNDLRRGAEVLDGLVGFLGLGNAPL